MFFRPAFVIAAAVQAIYECIARMSVVKVVCNHTKQDVASRVPSVRRTAECPAVSTFA